MKNNLSATAAVAVLGATLFLSACSGGDDEPAGANTSTAVPAGNATSPEGQIPAELARVDFAVDGMTCGGCAVATRAALKKLDGVQDAGAEYDEKTEAGTAWALYTPSEVTPERMMEAIRELGYKPQLVQD